MRSAFSLAEGIVYLNHGAFGATPRRVLQAQTQWREQMEAQPVDFLHRRLSGLLDTAVADIAAFVGARAADIVFAENATNAINAVIQSLELGAGDEVVFTSYAHPGSLKPLQHQASRRGVRLVEVALPYPVRDTREIVDAVAARLTRRTRLAVLDHISSSTAVRMPLEGERGLVALCRAHGVPVLIDAAHAPGHIPVDVVALGADYYVGNCHKWLFAPRGCAFLWAREEHQGALHPTVISEGYTAGAPGAWAEEFHWVGTRDPSAWLAVSEALAWVRELGPEAIREHNRRLCEQGALHLVERLGLGSWDTGLPVPPDLRCAMTTLPLPLACPPDASAAEEVNTMLWQRYRIEVPIIVHRGRCWFRICAQIYNVPDDYDRLADALAELTTGSRT